MEEAKQVLFVQNTLNSCLTLGVSPPKTCDKFVALFDGHVTKDALIRFFTDGRIQWIMGTNQNESYDAYNRSMNDAALRVLGTREFL